MKEPVLAGFAVLILVIVLAALALGLTEAQIAGAVVVVGSVLALIVRSRVTPV
jgi:hypothetical protein